MTRTLGALATHVAGYSHKLACLLRLDLKDGTVICLTDHNNELTCDLGDGAQTYSPNPGVSISDITLAAGFEASNFEAFGPVVAPFTRVAVLGGRFRAAVVRLAFVNWETLDWAPVMRGKVGACRIEGDRWVLECRNAADAFNQTQGGVLSPYCRTWFGSPKCGVTRTPYETTVAAVTSAGRFTVDLAGDHADDFFNFGSVLFTSGALAGTDEARILDYAGSSALVDLFEPMLQAPEVGDGVTLYRGCSKLLKSDDASVPTCLSWDNVVNFRGHPEVPGSRFYHKITAAGTNYE